MKFADDLEKAEQQDEADDNETGDRCKNRWLQKRKRAGQVPEELLSYLEKCGRQDTTEAVNRLVKRGKEGRFELCLENMEGDSQQVRPCQGQRQGPGLHPDKSQGCLWCTADR